MEILKNVPLPAATGGRMLKGQSKYGYHLLAVGDSVQFPLVEREAVRVAARHFSKANGVKLTSRVFMNEEGNRVIGIWRVE